MGHQSDSGPHTGSKWAVSRQPQRACLSGESAQSVLQFSIQTLLLSSQHGPLLILDTILGQFDASVEH